MFKVKDRFGDVEIISIARGMLQLICSCGHMFKRKAELAKMHGLRNRCAHCSKVLDGVEPIDLNRARPYTTKELKFIKDFEKKTKVIK